MPANRPRIAHQPSREQLLARHECEPTDMADTRSSEATSRSVIQVPDRSSDATLLEGSTLRAGSAMEDTVGDARLPVYRVYKRRWFGLVQLVLLNIIVSWDVRCGRFSVV